MTSTNDHGQSSTSATDAIMQYRRGEIAWRDLVAFVEHYAWQEPDLPDAGDWNGWAAGPNTFQLGTWGEVTGLHLDEVLTDDEYFALTEVYDAAEPFGKD